jgi:hypothetical protein
MVGGETSPAIKGERALGADRSLVVLTHRFGGSTGLSNGSQGSEPGRSTSGLEKWVEERSPGRLSDAEAVAYDITSSLRNDLRSTAVHGLCKVLKANPEFLHMVLRRRNGFGKPEKAKSELLHLLISRWSL